MVLWQNIKGKGFFIILVKRSRFRTFLLVFFLFSIYIFVFSESGILERIKLNNKFDILDKRIGVLKQENSELDKLYENYSASKYSSLDIVRSGYTYNNAKILLFTGDSEEGQGDDSIIKVDLINFNYSHLRIIWLIISSMIIIIYFTKNTNEEVFSDE